MTIKQRIISYLQNHPEGIDDDELARALGLKARQQVNAHCRELEKEGLVIRRHVSGKFHNFWTGQSVAVASSALSIPQNSQNSLPKSENWFWEGNVQSKVRQYLEARGFYICSVANTASHQQGIDIVAEKDGKLLWVSVKGYPKGTDKTNPSARQDIGSNRLFSILLSIESEIRTLCSQLLCQIIPVIVLLRKKSPGSNRLRILSISG
jgi:biotin operon repressor